MNPYIFSLLGDNKVEEFKTKTEPGLVPIKLQPEQIVDIICKYFNVRLDELRAKDRKSGIIIVRKLVCYFLKYKATLRTICSLLNMSDHSSIIHHQQDVVAKIAIGDKLIINHVKNIKNEIKRIEISELC